MDFREKIKTAMDKQGKSLGDLKRRTGIDKSQSSKYLTGEKNMGSNNLERFFDFVELEVVELKYLQSLIRKIEELKNKLKENGGEIE